MGLLCDAFRIAVSFVVGSISFDSSDSLDSMSLSISVTVGRGGSANVDRFGSFGRFVDAGEVIVMFTSSSSGVSIREIFDSCFFLRARR